ncbi:hypothetical protein THTE_3867 [Thermogutta terrifontis]|uniref:Uncharacterized protein n=1 Tax=Thermogutta terrifontis TaxID=1331910 RepID=A0A286RKK3_9BACT|nr:hypothetical protein THTE_3867 [Thermogutta terrifontis]
MIVGHANHRSRFNTLRASPATTDEPDPKARRKIAKVS